MSRGTVHKLIFTAVQVLQYSIVPCIFCMVFREYSTRYWVLTTIYVYCIVGVVQHIWYNKTVFLVLNSTCSVQYNVHVSYCTGTLYFSVHSTSLLVQYIQDIVQGIIIIMVLDTWDSTYRMHKCIIEN